MKSKRIVVTRAVEQAGKLVAALENRGAIPVLYPCIAIAPPEDTRDIDYGLKMTVRGEYDWVVFTSINAVTAVAKRLDELGLERTRLSAAKIAAVGPGTADAIESHLEVGVTVVPPHHEAEGLVETLSDVSGDHVFLPQSDLARPILVNGLTNAGAIVKTAAAYRTVLGSGGADLPVLLFRNAIDAVTFTSSSTVDNFLERFSKEGGDLASLKNVCVVCLGAKTTKTAEDNGISVTATPPENTLEALVESLAAQFQNE
ncbi:MAG: uroporphyrinogen-III synthase [Candidatus Latescibacterota bacterium]|nr:MAG: uroporphyrinogen-III synthase [Candidatus Latescibacterota bacterium]